MPHPYLDHPRPIAFAHRGGTEAAPENTMAAFEAAVRLGYRYLETDVHPTKDGVLVAFHDDRLDRVSDQRGAIADRTWTEIAQVELMGGQRIPRLDDLLAAWGDVRFNIDPKSDASAKLLPGVFARVGVGLDRVCIGSFSDRRLERLRAELGPDLCTSMGPREVVRLRLAALSIPTGPFAARCAQVPVWYGPIPVVDRRFVEAARSRDLQVHVWTVNEEREMEQLIRLGVDGIITDRPSLLKEVLEAHGLWR